MSIASWIEEWRGSTWEARRLRAEDWTPEWSARLRSGVEARAGRAAARWAKAGQARPAIALAVAGSVWAGACFGLAVVLLAPMLLVGALGRVASRSGGRGRRWWGEAVQWFAEVATNAVLATLDALFMHWAADGARFAAGAFWALRPDLAPEPGHWGINAYCFAAIERVPGRAVAPRTERLSQIGFPAFAAPELAAMAWSPAGWFGAWSMPTMGARKIPAQEARRRLNSLVVPKEELEWLEWSRSCAAARAEQRELGRSAGAPAERPKARRL